MSRRAVGRSGAGPLHLGRPRVEGPGIGRSRVGRPRTGRSGALAWLVALVLVAACADAGPTPSTGAIGSVTPTTELAGGSPVGTPGSTPASPPVTAAPSPSATPTLAQGSLAVTVVDRLRVRSQPRVSDDSVKYEPLLPAGTQLTVIEGPVEASGYAWYHVAPVAVTLTGGVADGWVAMADRDGTPWIAPAADPLAGLEFARSSVERSLGTAAQADRAAASINAFALDMYHRLRADPGLNNLVFSPASVALALAMARAGAGGTTATEMDAVLHTSGWKSLSGGLSSLDQELAGHDATWIDDGGQMHALSLRIANAAFGQQGWSIEQRFLDAIARAFGAQLGLVDYGADPEAARQVINAWVSRQTAQRIPELLQPPNVTAGTRLVLVNAIYLKAGWLTAFDPGSTKDRAFTMPDGSTIDVPTMLLSGGQDVPYATGSGWKATELRYIGADGSTPLAMTIIEPDDIDAFGAGLTTSKLERIVGRLDAERTRLGVVTRPGDPAACGTYPYSVRLFMPRFGIDTRADLGPVLSAMGMRAAFDPAAADFSGISTRDPLFISSVIHQANIDVDEQGTEAAAATAIGFDTTGGCAIPQPVKTVTLRLDRPFLFVVRDVATGAILFMGRVLDPSVRG